MAERIAAGTRAHAWVVLEDDDRVVGYAYGGPHEERTAYRFRARSASTSSRVGDAPGSGRALYGYRMAVAGMTLPNEASVGLHRAMGF